MKKLLQTLVLLTLTFSLHAHAEINDSPVDNKSTYHISDNMDLITAHDVQYEKPKIMIKMVYPKLSASDNNVEAKKTDGDNDETTTPVNTPTSTANAFNEQVTQIIKDEIVYFKQRVADSQDFQKTLAKGKIKNRLTIDYNSAVMNLDDAPIISIRFIMQGYVTGMAHPFRRYRTINFDFDDSKALQLSDLFDAESNYLDAIAQFSNASLSKQIRADAMLAGGAAPTQDNYRNWNINPSGLRITFDEATVAPYVYGSKTVLIPYSVLKEFINPESVLGRCLEHRKRCMHDPLLTGGFIDEAANTSHGRLNPALG